MLQLTMKMENYAFKIGIAHILIILRKMSSQNMINLDDVLIAPIPLINTHEYTVIDGNHRVCNQIHSGKKTIKSKLVIAGLAVCSLSTPLQACLYCFLWMFQKYIIFHKK